MANLNGVTGDLQAQTVTYLMNRFNPFVDKANDFYNILKALKAGQIAVDRIQILEDLRVTVLPPTPPDTPCDKAAGQAFQEASQNKTPLTDLENVGKPELAEVNNGSPS